MGFSLSDVHKLIHSASDRSMVRIVRTGTQMAAGHITALGGCGPTCMCPTKKTQAEPVIGNVCTVAIGCKPC